MSLFHVGNTVRVTNPGECYTSYEDFLAAYASSCRQEWQRNRCPQHEAVARVVAMAEHPRRSSEGMLYVIQTGSQEVFIVGESGLEKVEEADVADAFANELEAGTVAEAEAEFVVTEVVATTCAHCGAIIEDPDSNNTCVQIGCDYYCDGDCASNEGHTQCEDCNVWIHENHATYIERHGYVCDGCYSRGPYHYCDECEDYFHDDDIQQDDNIVICDRCFENHYYRCESCNNLVHSDNVSWCDDTPYCDECYSNLDDNDDSTVRHDYSYKPEPIFCGRGDLYMGVELEVDKGDGCDSIIPSIVENEMLYCKRDGSLGDRGVEIVSHPATLDYHMSTMDWGRVAQICVENGYKSHDTNTCGIHVHVNRSFFSGGAIEQDLNIAKVILIIGRFWDKYVIPFTRRKTENLEQWAAKDDLDVKCEDTPFEVSSKLNRVKSRGRYRAINLQNEDTIEFRIFRGTLKMNSFYAILQFVEVLCRFAKTVGLNQIDTLEWADIFKAATLEPVRYAALLTYLAEKTEFTWEQKSNDERTEEEAERQCA